MSASGVLNTHLKAQPTMIVVAGPAGSGKSTVFPVASLGAGFFSVDDRCAELNGGSFTGITAEIRARAGGECQAFIEEHIASRTSFAVETTLRTRVAIEQARAAKVAGFWTLMLFITTGDVRINVARITARGLMGGHSSPVEEIGQIFEASMGNLPSTLSVFDRVECFDNRRTGERPVRVLAFEGGRLAQRSSPLPDWASSLASLEASR